MLKMGHRGAKGHIAENTLESFEKAIALGADGLELDVHLCATGEVIVIHDFTVNRTTNGSGNISELSLSEIKGIAIDGAYKVPLLTEVLDNLGNKTIINIELKGNGTAKPVAAILKDYLGNKGFIKSNILVSSFNKEELLAFKNCNIDVPIGVLTETGIDEALQWAKELSALAIHADHTLLNQDIVRQIQQAGYKVFAWTVNEPGDIAGIKAFNVDGIISDYPDRL